ncbi:hypothetical protein E8E13_000177 [Curvularia kusanoi]|uniref:TNT domain-containing protein n=1 Tax=Curvularia kusanoi TaxID=90978 RepID=A0A9P4TN14_CURKU|nr:hypothetical protein E8E13_000177 [Curvularia kusanoi]
MTDFCDGVTGNGDDRCLCNEGDLGPKNLQNARSPKALLEGYQRLGQLKPAKFLEKWRTQKLKDGKQSTQWNWPNASQEGFLLDENGRPISGTCTLEIGVLIDRFGHEDTPYFAPFATPYRMRSLPPSSLNDDYAVYEVRKTLSVLTGPIAPGFEQPGLGTQYIAKMEPGELYGGTWLRKLGHEEVLSLFDEL